MAPTIACSSSPSRGRPAPPVAAGRPTRPASQRGSAGRTRRQQVDDGDIEVMSAATTHTSWWGSRIIAFGMLSGCCPTSAAVRGVASSSNGACNGRWSASRLRSPLATLTWIAPFFATRPRIATVEAPAYCRTPFCPARPNADGGIDFIAARQIPPLASPIAVRKAASISKAGRAYAHHVRQCFFHMLFTIAELPLVFCAVRWHVSAVR
jgi:hypothetical protein